MELWNLLTGLKLLNLCLVKKFHTLQLVINMLLLVQVLKKFMHGDEMKIPVWDLQVNAFWVTTALWQSEKKKKGNKTISFASKKYFVKLILGLEKFYHFCAKFSSGVWNLRKFELPHIYSQKFLEINKINVLYAGFTNFFPAMILMKFRKRRFHGIIVKNFWFFVKRLLFEIFDS